MSSASPRRASKGHPFLRPDQVRTIRSLYAAGGISLRELGRQYDVSNQTIGALVHRSSHKRVADDEACSAR